MVSVSSCSSRFRTLSWAPAMLSPPSAGRAQTAYRTVRGRRPVGRRLGGIALATSFPCNTPFHPQGGRMDGIQFLKQEHEKAKGMFQKIEGAGQQERGQLWKRLAPELKL